MERRMSRCVRTKDKEPQCKICGLTKIRTKKVLATLWANFECEECGHAWTASRIGFEDVVANTPEGMR